MDKEHSDDSSAPGPSQAPVTELNINTESFKPSSSQAIIWTFYKRSSKTEAICNTCRKPFKTPTGSTSALIRHLQNKHQNIYKQYSAAQSQKSTSKEAQEKQKIATVGLPITNQPKILEHFSSSVKYAKNNPKAVTITKAIASWMAKSFHPYSLVEEEGFRQLLGILEPKYNLPCRTTFSRKIVPELYEETKKRIEAELIKNKAEMKSLSITTDLWTSASNDAFISVTGHFVDPEYSIRTICLSNSYFPEEHNAINISSKLTSLVEEWGLRHNKTMPIFCITDNAANMVSAVNLTPWVHLRCFAHTLQLALGDAKKDVPGMLSMLSKARSIVGHYKHSCSAQLRLTKIQEQLGNSPLQLIQDCETRWNSEYNMLSRLVHLKQAVSAELASSNKPHNLSFQEWELAEGFVHILKPIDDATTMTSSASLPTLSSVLPLLETLKVIIRKFILAGKRGIVFARALDKALNSRFPVNQYFNNKHYLLAMLVDPRYKALILDDVTKRIAVELLKKEALEFQGELFDQDYLTSQPSSSSGSMLKQGTAPEEEFSLWSHLKTLSEKSQTNINSENIVNNQIESYLNLPCISMEENPSEWWKANCQLFGLVSLVAKRYLSIPATEVASERVFSSAGNVVNERRRALTQEHVSELVFLHHNL